MKIISRISLDRDSKTETDKVESLSLEGINRNDFPHVYLINYVFE